MSIPLYGAVGNYFNRLGKIAALIKNLKSYQYTQLTAMTDVVNGVVAQYNAESDIQAIMGGGYLGVLGGTGNIISGLAQRLAVATANRMVFRDNPQINQTLTQANILASLLEINRQMRIAGVTILAQTVSGTPSSFVGTGNGIVNVSLKRPFDGLSLENAFAENLRIVCNADSYSGGAVAGNEGFSITGAGSQTDFLAFNWPLGSNAQNGYNAIDGNVDNGSGNLLTNSGFNSWTVNVPNNWTINLGASTIAKEVSTIYDGAAALRLTGDGATLSSWQQQFGNSAGTLGSLVVQTQYSFNIFARRDGVAPGAGILQIDLVDGGGVIINDANNVPNSFTIDLTQLATAYASFTGTFRTPVILPAQQFLRFHLTTALTNNRQVYLDKGSLGLMGQLYTMGPSLALHAGSVPFVVGDLATCQINNSRGVGGTLSTFQTVYAQVFGAQVFSNELLLPSAALPTVVDANFIL